MKARIGKVINTETNEIFFQIQFKLDEERIYNGFSTDVFKTESEANEALEKHNSGERKYSYCASVDKVKRSVKGNRVDIKKVLAYHVLRAENNLPGSVTWIEINQK